MVKVCDDPEQLRIDSELIRVAPLSCLTRESEPWMKKVSTEVDSKYVYCTVTYQ